jgi:septal ring factor EnvC (AmiA/AmiB activator)
MKSKIAVVILIVICLALGVGLVTQRRKHAQEKQELDDRIALQSENLQKTSGKLEEQTQVNMRLEGDLVARSNDLAVLSSNVNKLSVDLEKTDAQAKATAEQLRTAQAELAKKDQKISELEGERLVLGKQMDQLTNSIGELEKQIAATEKKLVTTRGEKEFLVRELARLRAEKADLDRQFNDVAVLRGQISKLKEEMAISRRLEFIRLNLFGVTAKGGAEKLMTPARPALEGGTNYDLNVEIRQGGGARVVAPPTAILPTNAFRTNPPPAGAPGFPLK